MWAVISLLLCILSQTSSYSEKEKQKKKEIKLNTKNDILYKLYLSDP